MFVIRKTYGYGKKEDYIALSQFERALNISKVRASQVVNSLQEKKILTVKENINGLTKKYIFNKHLKQWELPLRKSVTVKEKRNDRKGFTKSPLRKTLTTKETITKETIQKKKTFLSDSFEKFWKTYPRKQNKAAAKKAWDKISLNSELLENILSAISKQKEGPDWIKNKGQFIPHPASWLNNKRWEDEEMENIIAPPMKPQLVL